MGDENILWDLEGVTINDQPTKGFGQPGIANEPIGLG